MTYKKRGRSGYECGKGYKSKSNRDEGRYAKKEIEQSLKEHEAGEDYKYKHQSLRNINEKARLENRIKKYTKYVKEWKDFAKRGGKWAMGHLSRLRHELKKTKEKWKEKYGDKDDTN